jgi:phospholipid/cholesterol/gamma-HCH transport system permease protein
MVAALLERIGAQVLDVTTQAGDYVTLSLRSFTCIFKRPFDGRNLLAQLQAVGVLSVPIIALTSLAMSMVFAVQLSYGFRQFQAEGLAGRVEGLALVRELAPVITGLMMAGRIGTAMAAELGTMQVTEQIDALECLATDPVHYLFVPRILATAVMMPLLTGFSIYVGYWGGYLLLVAVQGQSGWVYAKDFYLYLDGRDLTIALVKGLVFGLIIATVGCWRGFRTRGGAVEVGNAPTQSVVTSSVWILVADFFLTKLLLV